MAAFLFPEIKWSLSLLSGRMKGMEEVQPASKNDFQVLTPPQTLSLVELVAYIKDRARDLSVYVLDARDLEVVLVETPGVDLTRAAFMYQTQRREATRMVTVPWAVAAQVYAPCAAPSRGLCVCTVACHLPPPSLSCSSSLSCTPAHTLSSLSSSYPLP